MKYVMPWTRLNNYRYKFLDSYFHYRDIVGLSKIHSIYRTFYYEIKGKEPYA